ncbi:MAG: hypothetical protein ABI540_09985 [Spartobacteria bacterium]
MAKKTQTSARENVGGSVQQQERSTTGRRRQEKRLASGNTRSGQVESKKKVNQAAGRTRPTKRPSSPLDRL